jgi:hypothetical protein
MRRNVERHTAATPLIKLYHYRSKLGLAATLARRLRIEAMPEQPTNVIQFKRRLSWREAEIIDHLQKCNDGVPLSQCEIICALAQARSIHGDDLTG